MLFSGLIALVFAGCSNTQSEGAQAHTSEVTKAHVVEKEASVSGGQRGQGKAYEIVGSEVWDVADPVSGRTYQVFVALPPSYAKSPERHYPVLYVTDAGYGFPIIRQIGRRLNGGGQKIEEFILVGLSYAIGEEGMPSRRRDYTPTPAGAHDAPPDAVHGKGDAYMSYLRSQVFPFVGMKYRVDEARRLFLGHSYGGGCLELRYCLLSRKCSPDTSWVAHRSGMTTTSWRNWSVSTQRRIRIFRLQSICMLGNMKT